MAQSDILEREKAVYIAEELAFGVAPSGSFPNAFTRTMPLGGDVSLGDLATEMLDVADVRVRRDDNPPKVRGLQIGSKVGPYKWNLKAVPTAAQLPAAGTPGSLDARILYRHGFGTEYAAAGTTISGSGSTDTELDVTSGAAIKKGTWIAVVVAGQLEVTKVLDVDTGATPDRVTVAPALSAAPATGAVVKQLYNYVRAESSTKSLSIREAFVGDTTAQHTVSGCYGELAFDFPEFGKLPTVSLSPMATSYTLGAQSISVASAADPMDPTAVWTPSVYLSPSIDRTETVVCEGFTFELMEASELVRDPSATQTVHSVVRVGGRPTAVKVALKIRFDSDPDTAFAADTEFQFLATWRIGSGATATVYVWELPKCRIVGQPKRMKIGERLHLELTLEGLVDDTVTLASETGSDLDRILASCRFAVG